MLMAKSCHDIDWICWMMNKSKCLSTYSIGSLAHFRKENKPAGAGDAKRCQGMYTDRFLNLKSCWLLFPYPIECPSEVERKCPYSAIRIYNEAERGKSWAMTFLEEDTPEVSQSLCSCIQVTWFLWSFTFRLSIKPWPLVHLVVASTSTTTPSWIIKQCCWDLKVSPLDKAISAIKGYILTLFGLWKITRPQTSQ